jgi:hypothetical protein
VSGRDLHGARPERRVDRGIRDDRDLPAVERMTNGRADQGAYRSSSGCTAIPVSPSIVSTRVVAQAIDPLPSDKDSGT